MVKEFTPDMTNSMQKIVRKCFPRTLQIVNKIHVFTLAYEAMRDLRMAYRWQIMKNETAFSTAGIYDIWVDKDSGKQHATFSIIPIVTDPLTDYIHNTKYRMLVIFVIRSYEKSVIYWS